MRFSFRPPICRSLTTPLEIETKIFENKMNFDPEIKRSFSHPISMGTDVPDGRLRTKSYDQNTNIKITENFHRKRTFDESNNHEEPANKIANCPSSLLRPYIPPNSQSSDVTCSSSSSENKLNANVCETGVCNICHSNPNNAVFVHR